MLPDPRILGLNAQEWLAAAAVLHEFGDRKAELIAREMARDCEKKR